MDRVKVDEITNHSRILHRWIEVVTLVLTHLGDKAPDILSLYAYENMSSPEIANYIDEVTLYFTTQDREKKANLQEYAKILHGTEFADDYCLYQLLVATDDELYGEIMAILGAKPIRPLPIVEGLSE